MIGNFDDYIRERLHINDDVSEYASEIFPLMSDRSTRKFSFTNTPIRMNIRELTIELIEMDDLGYLDLDNCKKFKSGWDIKIILNPNFNLLALEHELFHALRLSIIGKDRVIRNLNHIRSFHRFKSTNHPEIMNFMKISYLANDEEVNAKLHEFDDYVKSIIENDAISFDAFESLIKSSDIPTIYNLLINFKCDDIFRNTNGNSLSKLFYIIEENKKELDRYEISKFRQFIFRLKSIFSNNYYHLNTIDTKIYTPDKGKSFYDKWIPSQGERLKKRVYSLFDRYSTLSELPSNPR